MSRKILAQRFVVALVLAFGFGAVWALMIGAASSIASAFRPSVVQVSEGLAVTTDGTPLIRTMMPNIYVDMTLRTLEGQTVELESSGERWLTAAVFPEPYRSPRWVSWPITWKQRIGDSSDFNKPPAAWVIVRDGGRPGHAYLAGYDVFSKRRLGHIGREGFRATRPPSDEWFDFGNATLSHGDAAVASAGFMVLGSVFISNLSSSYYSAFAPKEGRLEQWLVFLKDGETIQEVNLRNRQVRSVTSLENLLALAVTTQPSNRSPESDPADEEPVNTQRELVHRLLARCEDRIVNVNPFDGTQ